MVENQKQGKSKLFYFAVILLVFSLIVFFININRVMELTGRATGTGTANLTVEQITEINFTTNSIAWGTGTVSPGNQNATLNTAVSGAGNITNGNWTGNTAGLVLENIGNKNVSLVLQTAKNASDFVGGTSPSYQYNVTNVEAMSCTNDSGGNLTQGGVFNITLGNFYDVNETRTICNVLEYLDAQDSIRIDVQLVIPNDATETGSAIGDIFTATATAV